jgi:uncharacterized membrane protein YpjA
MGCFEFVCNIASVAVFFSWECRMCGMINIQMLLLVVSHGNMVFDVWVHSITSIKLLFLLVSETFVSINDPYYSYNSANRFSTLLHRSA